jgi:hypothetical protein
MWWDAHGRLAAIVVVGASLFACAATPKPVEAIDPEHHNEPACSGSFPAVPAEEIAGAIENMAHLDCGPGAASGGRYGEIRVVVRPRQDDKPIVETALGSGLSEEDHHCVEAAVRSALWSIEQAHSGPREASDFGKGLDLYIALGTATPLFPSTQGLIDQWRAATRAQPARARFEAQLPAEVRLEDDCLSIPNRPAFSARLDRWLAKVETPLDPFWQLGNRAFAGLGRHGNLWSRAYLVGNEALMFRYRTALDPSRQAICLLPLDDRLRADLQARVARQATCWAGDLGEVLLHPRTEFPTGRRFKTVAVGAARTCAIDDGGTPVCCGERLTEDIPAGTFATIAVGQTFDCGLTADGSMRCWGDNAPAGGAVIAGPYSQLAVGSRDICAIRRDSGALECWLPDAPRVVTVARGRIRDARGLDDSLCALLEDGRISCRDSDSSQGWGELRGRFRAFAASGTSVCGVTAAGNALECWRRDRAGWLWSDRARDREPSVVAAPAQPSDVALAGSDGCVLGRSGQIACWRSRARNRWDGRYGMIASSDDRICAVTVDGRVQCDRPWPFSQTPAAPTL